MKDFEFVPKWSKHWWAVRDDFLEAQDRKCAICSEPFTEERPPKLDHCHDTGFIRGVLCSSCNIKLGWLEKRRRKIEDYLSRTAEFIAAREQLARDVPPTQLEARIPTKQPRSYAWSRPVQPTRSD